MSQILDFNKTKKRYLTIVLPDEDKTRLQVMTPSKSLLAELSTSLPDPSVGLPVEEDLKALYNFCARLMSRNKTGKQITGEQLAECLDFEDLITFFGVFTDFINDIASSKN